MKRLRESVATYLAVLGQHQAPPLGGRGVAETRQELEKKARATFQRRLLEEQRFNRWLFVVIVFLLACLYVAGIYLVLKNRNEAVTAGTLLGGEFLSLLLVIRWMRQVLLDKVYTDLLITASNELEPESFVKFVATWYELASRAQPETGSRQKKRSVAKPVRASGGG